MTVYSGPVVIGVDGSEGDRGALKFGIAEARRLGVPVRLVHVVPDYATISPLAPVSPSDLEDLGNEIVRTALDVLRTIDADIEADGLVGHGHRARQLAKAAASASAVVVGRDARPLLERLLRGNTATGVAAIAPCPVITVPADWQPTPHHACVLVGVKASPHATELLGDAFAQAASRGARLVAMHAWKLPSGYDDVIESRVTTDEWTRRAVDELETAMAEWRGAYPDVVVETRFVHEHPVKALVDASAEADVLVIVRREHGVPAAMHLGGTARALLRTAHSPVRVVPAVPAVTGAASPDVVLEEAGAVRK